MGNLEKEILFAPFSHFEVDKSGSETFGRFGVHLKEVLIDSKSIIIPNYF